MFAGPGAQLAVRRLVLLAALAAFGCYSQKRRSLDRGHAKVSPREDRIGIDDTFDVRVYGEPELSGNFRVATDGSIDYPLAGRLQVVGPASR